MQRIILLCIPMLLILSCKNDPTTKLVEKRAMVMKVHDEAMIHHGTINKNKRLLKGVLPSIELMSEQQEIVTSLKLLEDANTAMMQWMRTYKDPSDEVPMEEKMAYYNAVQKEMEAINLQIIAALEHAEPVILKYQK